MALLSTLSSFAKLWRDEAFGRIETLLLMALSIGLFIGSAGFLFGIPVSPWPMAFGFACAVAGAALVSWKRLLAFAAVASLCVGASLLTFSYTGSDAFVYHFPMQRLLVDGWNPVFDSTLEKFQVVLQEQGGGYVGIWHTLFLPRVSSLCGALLASLMRTFAADAFLGYVLIFALWRTAGRFARAQWLCGAFAANLFAAGLVFSSKITSFLAGQVDYSTYATLLIAIFSYLCWRKAPRGGDLLLSLLGIALCILSKSTGLICGLLFCLIVFACHWRRAEIRWGAVALCGFVLIVGFSPFVTNWVQYGSPFYPNMTFDPRVEIRDITADFTGNADALSMGFLSRVVYAWVSPGLAVKGCAWLSGNPDFAPVFSVAGGVAGLGGAFRLLLLLSVIALVLSRPNAVTLLCVLLFVSGNLAPLKYIGYARYFPQLWAIPFLAAYNVLYAPRPCLEKLGNLVAWGKPVVLAGIALLTLLSAGRVLAYQGRQWKFERERQSKLEEMAALSHSWRLIGTDLTFTLRKRLGLGGIRLSEDPLAPTFRFEEETRLPLFEGLPQDSLTLAERFPICDTVQALIQFPWLEALIPPRPLFCPKGQSLQANANAEQAGNP